MADPARIKPEALSERITSCKEEDDKSDETEDGPSTSKAADENKHSSSHDQSNQDVKSVSDTSECSL